ERMEERGERRDHLVGGFDEQADGQELIDIHRSVSLGRALGARSQWGDVAIRSRCPARSGAGPGGSRYGTAARRMPLGGRDPPETGSAEDRDLLEGRGSPRGGRDVVQAMA